MARMPGAQWLGEHSPKRLMTEYDIVCVHTIVGYAPADAAHFSVKANGTIQQSRDTKYRSAANLNGNHRIIAIENEDHGSAFGSWGGSNVPALTDAQVEANAKILRWAHETHGIPLQRCPNSRPESRGLAYHRQGIDGNFGNYAYPGRVSGGEVWTESYGKVCPGDRRISQLNKILALAKGESYKEDDDMAWDEQLDLWHPGDKDSKDSMHAGQQLNQARGYAEKCHELVKEARTHARRADIRTKRIEEAFKAMAAGMSADVQEAVEAALKDAVIDVDINVNQPE